MITKPEKPNESQEQAAAIGLNQTETTTGSMVKNEDTLIKVVPVKLSKKTKRLRRTKLPQLSGSYKITYLGSGFNQGGNPCSASGSSKLPAQSTSAHIVSGSLVSKRLPGPAPGNIIVPAPMAPRGFYRPTQFTLASPTTRQQMYISPLMGPPPYRFVSPTSITSPRECNYTPSYRPGFNGISGCPPSRKIVLRPSMPTVYSGPDPLDLSNSTASPGNLPFYKVVFDPSKSTERLGPNPDALNKNALPGSSRSDKIVLDPSMSVESLVTRPDPLDTSNSNAKPESGSSKKNVPGASASKITLQDKDFPTSFDIKSLKTSISSAKKPVATTKPVFFPLNMASQRGGAYKGLIAALGKRQFVSKY